MAYWDENDLKGALLSAIRRRIHHITHNNPRRFCLIHPSRKPR
jgi:hypothetical protein